jgi:Ca2+/Na+ antiporter
MKLKNSTFLLLLIFLAGFSSCSIQKRHYLNGYNLSWKNKTERVINTDVKNETEKPQETDFALKAEEITTSENTASASLENTAIVLPKKEALINPTFKIQSKIATDTNYVKETKSNANGSNPKVAYISSAVIFAISFILAILFPMLYSLILLGGICLAILPLVILKEKRKKEKSTQEKEGEKNKAEKDRTKEKEFKKDLGFFLLFVAGFFLVLFVAFILLIAALAGI